MNPDDGTRGAAATLSDASFPAWLARRALKAAFALLYHQLAPAYDAISWLVSAGRWAAWRRSSLSELPAGRVLEIGPGTGHLLLETLESGRDAYGLDNSPEMLRIARKRLASHGFEARLIPGDARRLPFGDATFDGLLLTFPAPFLDERFWREAARVMRPGGRIVMVLGAESGHWPWPGILEWALARLAGGASAAERGDLHLAPGLVGRTVDRRMASGVVRMLLAERLGTAWRP